jgi:hypothetical protein
LQHSKPWLPSPPPALQFQQQTELLLPRAQQKTQVVVQQQCFLLEPLDVNLLRCTLWPGGVAWMTQRAGLELGNLARHHTASREIISCPHNEARVRRLLAISWSATFGQAGLSQLQNQACMLWHSAMGWQPSALLVPGNAHLLAQASRQQEQHSRLW